MVTGPWYMNDAQPYLLSTLSLSLSQTRESAVNPKTTKPATALPKKWKDVARQHMENKNISAKPQSEQPFNSAGL